MQIIGRSQHGILAVKSLGEIVLAGIENSCQSQIENLNRTGAIDEQIARLDVAVHESGFVGVLQSQGGLANVIRGSSRIELAVFGDDILQALAFHVFHHQEMRFPVLIDVVSADDVRMIEFASVLRLCDKTAPVPTGSSSSLSWGKTFSATWRFMKICSQR